MLTFAFTVLVLILAAGAAFFWLRYEMARERGIRRQSRRAEQKKIKALTAEIVELKAAQKDFDARFSILEVQARKDLGIPAKQVDMFSQMEKRKAEKLTEVVSVGGMPLGNAA